MRRNRSYIFFREAAELAPEDGPIGGAGVPLTPGRSLAVDRTSGATACLLARGRAARLPRAEPSRCAG